MWEAGKSCWGTLTHFLFLQVLQCQINARVFLPNRKEVQFCIEAFCTAHCVEAFAITFSVIGEKAEADRLEAASVYSAHDPIPELIWKTLIVSQTWTQKDRSTQPSTPTEQSKNIGEGILSLATWLASTMAYTVARDVLSFLLSLHLWRSPLFTSSALVFTSFGSLPAHPLGLG